MARATKEHVAAVRLARKYLGAIAVAVGATVDANDRATRNGVRVAVRVGATVDVEGAPATFRPWADPVSEAIKVAKEQSHA